MGPAVPGLGELHVCIGASTGIAHSRRVPLVTPQARLAWYCGSLPLLALAVLWNAPPSYALWPSLWQVVLAVGCLLLVWHFGLPAAVGGVRSLERVPQIALLLVGGPLPAALQCALAALIFPFTHTAYRQGSWRIAVLRALNNMTMMILMMVAGGAAYSALGGQWPMPSLRGADLIPLGGMILAMQAVNIVMLIGYHAAAGRPIARHPASLVDPGDLLFSPVGVLAALVWLELGALAALLMALFIGIFIVSFHGGVWTVPFGRHEQAREATMGLADGQRLDALAGQIFKQVRESFVFDEFMFGVLDRKLDQLDLRLRMLGGEPLPRMLRPRGDGLFGWVIERNQAMLVEDFARAEPAIRQRTHVVGLEPGSMLIAPIEHAGEVIGIISVQHLQPGRFRNDDLTLLVNLARRMAPRVAEARALDELDDYRADLERKVAERTRELRELVQERDQLLMELREKNQALDRLSREDPLTGLANRREFDHVLEREISVAARHSRSLCLALIDLDHFKQINDCFGHAAGDKVLIGAAGLLREHFRSSDLVARVGGEEFAVVLSDCSLDDARQRCERLRRAFAGRDWSAIHPQMVATLSGGLVSWQGESASRLLARVDGLLYRAKQAGRNGICHDPEPRAPAT